MQKKLCMPTRGIIHEACVSYHLGIAGFTNTGWYWRPKTISSVYGGIDGAPSQFQIQQYQLPRGHFIVLAIRYPSSK